ncbi:hypothetical protein LTR56_002234 [Elasticomyces elasticus]|nr:hypothetical protein LTR56_002234 [Elasticomyces elasticus]KAK3666111.1 hypothetical protein LTR22_003117 [Elasticomyces elasticus]KAK4929598.1 hypothetical protein LTR49_003896 [Elasticomyces elasticus]KAK5767445.1 hypothetical protein LTS12_002283 [Elasticomyces elasticus]
MLAFTLLAIVSATLVSAQSASQNASAAALAAQIPACAVPCDDAAILSTGCGLTEYACHCAHGAQLSQLIPACLKANATCSTADLTLFGSLPLKICAALNSTAPAGTGTAASAGITASANSTRTSTAVQSTTVTSAGSTYVSTIPGSATATPSGPTSSATGGPAPSSTNAASLNGAVRGLLGAVGAGILYLAL